MNPRTDKSKSDAKRPPVPQKAAPVIFDLTDRIPAMADDALNTLHLNAVRLQDSGTTVQRASASAMLPAIEAERADRAAKKLAATPPKKPRAPAKSRKAKIEEPTKEQMS